MDCVQEDPAHGDWCVNESEINVWVSATSLATGVVLENDGTNVGVHMLVSANKLQPTYQFG